MIERYEVVIWWSEEDGSYLAAIPELPGCMADGATRQKALANLEVIANEWVDTAVAEGWPIPEPKGHPVGV